MVVIGEELSGAGLHLSKKVEVPGVRISARKRVYEQGGKQRDFVEMGKRK